MGLPARGVVLLGALAILVAGALLFRKTHVLLTQPADSRLGEQVFQLNCAVCHGASAEGQGFAPPLGSLGHADHHPDWELYTFIADGKTGFGLMPAWKDRLSDREIRSVIAYIKTLWTDDQRASQQHINEVRPAPPR